MVQCSCMSSCILYLWSASKENFSTFTSSPYKIGSRERKFSTDFKNDLQTSYALLRCRIFARHKVWKIYFGGNDLGSENSQMGDIGPLILSAKTYMLWISSLTAFNLQNLVHRASPPILACSWYSTAVRSTKKIPRLWFIYSTVLRNTL